MIKCSLCPSPDVVIFYDVDHGVCTPCACRCVTSFMQQKEHLTKVLKAAQKGGAGLEKTLLQLYMGTLAANEFMKKQIIKELVA